MDAAAVQQGGLLQYSLKTTLGAGGFVLLGVAALAFLLTQISNRRLSFGSQPIYEVTAMFDNVGDLRAGARVSMSGMEVGRVSRIDLDASEQRAVVSMRLNSQFDRIPVDSSAAIYTQGILGRKFVGLTNGGSDVFLKNQDRIAATHSAMPLENVIGQLFTRYLKAKAVPPAGAAPAAGAAENGSR
jgi:phospholipid/cholesterol/gamma-HCH transport system substrate-binding protein